MENSKLIDFNPVWNVTSFNRSLHKRFWSYQLVSRNQFVATLKQKYYNTSILDTMPDFHKLIINISKLVKKNCVKNSYIQFSLISDPYESIINSPYIPIETLDTLKLYLNLNEVLKLNDTIGINKLVVSYD